MDREYFLKECTDWLSKFGYTRLSSSIRDEIIIFTFHYEGHPYYPIIECNYDGDEKHTRVYDASYPMFLTLTSGDIQFKHPDIINYITTFINISGFVKTSL